MQNHLDFTLIKLVTGTLPNLPSNFNNDLPGLRLKTAVNNSPTDRNLTYHIRNLDKRIDDNIADFNYQLVKQKIGNDNTISEQNVWKMKRIIAPKSVRIPHSVLDKSGNHNTDPCNVMTEY